MKTKEINSESKIIDMSKLHKYKQEIESTTFNNLKVVNEHSKNELTEAFFYKTPDNSYILDEYNEKKVKFKETRIKPDNQVEVIERIDNYFDYYETYYSNGNIKLKKIFATKLGFSIGSIYKYNDKGKLIEVTDTDEGFKFSFQDVFDFCKIKKINLQTNNFPTRIIKSTTPDGIKIWVIEYPNENKRKVETYVLDALNGNIINKEENDWPTFDHNVPNE